MLYEQGYITDDPVAMSVFLSLQLNKPLLIEGPASVGKAKLPKMTMHCKQT
jgi:MoxR-like ATPase